MPKRIVICSDGTGNTAIKGRGTNVFKLYEALDLNGHRDNEDLVEQIQKGNIDFDRCIATPDMMPLVGRLGKVLGPRGLMPNPKTGTVTDDTASAVEQSKAGKVEFRMDRNGNINVPVGKRSFEASALVENAETVLTAVKAQRPASARGAFVKNCTVSSTMGVGLRVVVRE